MKIVKQIQCYWIIRFGKYGIGDKRESKQCEINDPDRLIYCEDCDKHYCLEHWIKHNKVCL